MRLEIIGVEWHSETDSKSLLGNTGLLEGQAGWSMRAGLPCDERVQVGSQPKQVACCMHPELEWTLQLRVERWSNGTESHS